MKKIVIAGLAAVMAANLYASEETPSKDLSVKADTVRTLKHYKAGDNWFFGVFAGTNFSLSENIRFASFPKRFGPSVGISVGKYFSPAVGARVRVSYLNQHSMANTELVDAYPEVYGDGVYKFSMVSTFVDGLFNFNNIFKPYNENNRFNVVGVLGIGLNSAFGFDDKIKNWSPSKGGLYEVDRSGGTYLAIHAGLQLGYKVSDAVDINLEATYNATDDGYNGTRYDRKYDGYIYVVAGATYHFKDHYGDRRFKYVTMTDQAQIDHLNAQINKARAELANKPEPIVRVEKKVETNRVLDMTVSFIIDKYNITDVQKNNVQKVAEYLLNNPNINLIITGYADVQTGNPAYNLKLSERRANAVRDMLVNDFGVDPSRLRIDYKGDTVQPYDRKNEWNRVVIFVTEENNNK